MEQTPTDQPGGAPLRPEEERSLGHVGVPEVIGPPIPPSLLAIAQTLVSRWERELPTGVPRMPPMIMLTQDVRARMRDDIARVLNDALSAISSNPQI